MSMIVWDDQYNLGIKTIDAEHRELVTIINDLYDAYEQESAATVIDSILDRVDAYTQYHFAHEEQLMAQAGYPGLTAHCAEHRTLIGQLEQIRTKMKVEGPSQDMVESTLLFLKEWLIEHILVSDKAFAPHMIARGIQ